MIASSIKYQNFWLKRNKNLWLADVIVMTATSCFDWYCYFIWLSRALMNDSEDDVSLVGPTVINYGKIDALKLVI